MRTLYSLCMVAILCLSVLPACNDEHPQSNLLVGRWMAVEFNERDVSEFELVYEFSGGEFFVTSALESCRTRGNYTADDNVLILVITRDECEPILDPGTERRVLYVLDGNTLSLEDPSTGITVLKRL